MSTANDALDVLSRSDDENLADSIYVDSTSPDRASIRGGQQRPTPPSTPFRAEDLGHPLEASSSRMSGDEPASATTTTDGAVKDAISTASDEEKLKVAEEHHTNDRNMWPANEPFQGNGLESAFHDEAQAAVLKKMQQRMEFLESLLRDRGPPLVSEDDDNLPDEPYDERSSTSDEGQRRPAIPKLEYVEWEAFKNKDANETRSYAIEVLVGEPRYYYQEAGDLQMIKNSKGKSKVQSEMVENKEKLQSTKTSSAKELPHRIRVNSLPILSTLAQIDAEVACETEPMVILRPFKPLIFYERQIREVYEQLKSRWGEAEQLEVTRPLLASDSHINVEAKNAEVVEGKAVAAKNEGGSTLAQSTGAAESEDVEEKGLSSVQPENVSTSPGDVDVDQDRKDNGSARITSTGKPKSGVRNGVSTAVDGDQITNTAQTKINTQAESIADRLGESTSAKLKNKGKPRGEGKVRAINRTTGKGDLTGELEDLTDSVETLRDLRCLIEFMDREIQPVLDRLHSEDCRKVFFSDLWHIYKPGILIYAPLSSRVNDNISIEPGSTDEIREVDLPKERIQDVWKLRSTSKGRANLSQGDKDLNVFKVEAFYIDFDGSIFLPLTLSIWIKPFEGERDVTSLEFYPLRFVSKRKEMEANWLRRGKVFKNFMTPKHRYYTGKSLSCPPDGLRPVENDGFPKHADNVESQVIVDFSEALSEYPGWWPTFPATNLPEKDRHELHEDYPNRWWKDRARMKIKTKKNDLIYYDPHIDKKLMEACVEKDELTKSSPDSAVEKGGELSDEHLMLLPNRVFAFVMKNRKFAILTVDGLRDIKPRRDGFNDLQLPGTHKRIVSSLVHNHFHDKHVELNDHEAGNDTDIVRGKGKGLVVLLHGAPGVGKTSTAETVAEAYRKPLFPITCADLGLTAKEVEEELEERFHLAELWDCVLLLDEADVFLAQRTRTDVKRNSLVSVFLRVLEYFTGVLFLTTNRVGSIDEAFKSRIHIILYYPPLDRKQTMAIWEMNMNRLEDKKKRRNERFNVDKEEIFSFARQHYKQNSFKNAQWNGRQIRNAFQTAFALAGFEAYEAAQNSRAVAGAEPSSFEPHLKAAHFETVAKASMEYDDYLYKLRGKTDASRAFFDQERADQYQSPYAPPPRNTQPLTQRYPTNPPPPFAQYGGAGIQGQRSAGFHQQLPRRQQGYMDPRHQASLDPEINDDAVGGEGSSVYGQPRQGSANAFPRMENSDDESE